MQVTVQEITRGISATRSFSMRRPFSARRSFSFSVALALPLAVLFATPNAAQETHNLSDVQTQNAPAESVVQNLSDSLPAPASVNFSDQTGVSSNLNDFGDSAQSTNDQSSRLDNSPFTPPKSFSKFDSSNFIPPSKQASNETDVNAPPIDMNMLRQQLQPPADAAVPQSTQGYPVDPMRVLSSERLAPTDTQPVAQQMQPTQQMRARNETQTYGQMQSQPGFEVTSDDAMSAESNQQVETYSPIAHSQSSMQSSTQPQFEEPSRVAQIPNQYESIQPTAPIQSSILTPRNRSKSVETTTYNAPVEPAQPTTFDTKPKTNNLGDAKRLISNYDLSAVSSPLPGEPVSMLEMLQKTPLHKRPQMIRQYWETFSDWAGLQNCQTYVKWLNQIPRPASQADGILLHTAKSNARNKMLAAEIRLGQSLSELLEFIPTGDPNQSPVLPMDQPLISKYKTHYDWYNNRQMIPPQLKGIDQMLPKTLELITNRAQTVRNAQSATKQTQAALSNGQANIATVLEAGRLWQESLQGFVATVVAYNQAIGDYAMTISKNGRTAEQIESMLIPARKTEDVVKTAPAQKGYVPTAGENRTPITQSGYNSRIGNGSQAIGPNVGTYRAPVNTRAPAGSGVPIGAPKPANFGQPNAGQRNGTEQMNGQKLEPMKSGPTSQSFGDIPPGAGAPSSQTFRQPSVGGGGSGSNPNTGTNGGRYRPPSSPDRTTDNSNSFGGGSFQR